MHLNKEDVKKIIFIVAVAILLYTAIHRFSMVWGVIQWMIGIVFPFILGGCVAFMINVPMRCVEKLLFGHYHGKHEKGMKRVSRPVSLVVTLLLVCGIIFVVVFMVVPQLTDTIKAVYDQIPVFFGDVQNVANNMTERYEMIGDLFNRFDIRIDWSAIGSGLMSFVQSIMGNAFSSTVGMAMSIVNGVITFVVALVFGIYVLAQKEMLSSNVRKLMYAYLPEKRVDRLWEIGRLSNRTFSKFLSGQCLEALILGAMFLITMSIFRMPYALLISIVVAFAALIPMIGAFIGCVVGALLILIQSPIQALWFIVLFLVLQQVEGNLIYPRVVGNSVGLPAIWVLVAVTIGGNLMGIVGILLFIPLCSVIYALLREMVWKRLKNRRIPPEKIAIVRHNDEKKEEKDLKDKDASK